MSARPGEIDLGAELRKIELELAGWPKPNRLKVQPQVCAPNCARNRILGEGIERAPAGDCDCGAAYGLKVED